VKVAINSREYIFYSSEKEIPKNLALKGKEVTKENINQTESTPFRTTIKAGCQK
jgi:hypothetical protein